MELWIRTQKRMRLFKISLDVSIIAIRDEKNEIAEYMISCNDYGLGTYKTKERALEVLDEIQDLLVPKMIVKNEGNTIYGSDGNVYTTNISGGTDIQELSTCVYQMPED